MGSLVWGRRQGSARQAGARLLSRGEARMSSRYISHRYGEREEVRSSRATSRASSRAPSMTPSLAGSRASSVLDLSSIHPRATSQAPRGLPSGPRPKRWSSAMEYSNQRMEFSTSSGLPPMPLTLLNHPRGKTDFTSRRARCSLLVTKVKHLLQLSSPTSTSTTEALSTKEMKLCQGHFSTKGTRKGGEIFICWSGLNKYISHYHNIRNINKIFVCTM